MKKTLKVEVWSDVVCPWCAIGKRRLEAALAKFPRRDAVEIVWRAFELDPSAPALRPDDNATRLAQKYGRTKAEVAAMVQQVTDIAAKDGLDFHLAQARSGNTFDAHRVLHLAAERGIQDKVKERFFRGYMTEGEAIGDHDVLVRSGIGGRARCGRSPSSPRERSVRERCARGGGDGAQARHTRSPVLRSRREVRGLRRPARGGVVQALEEAWASVAGDEIADMRPA